MALTQVSFILLVGELCLLTRMSCIGVNANVMQKKCMRDIHRKGNVREKNLSGVLQTQQTGPLVIHVIVNN